MLTEREHTQITPIERIIVSGVVSAVLALAFFVLSSALLVASLALLRSRQPLKSRGLLHYLFLLSFFAMAMEPFIVEVVRNMWPPNGAVVDSIVCHWTNFVKYPYIVLLAALYTGRTWRFFLALNAGHLHRIRWNRGTNGLSSYGSESDGSLDDKQADQYCTLPLRLLMHGLTADILEHSSLAAAMRRMKLARNRFLTTMHHRWFVMCLSVLCAIAWYPAAITIVLVIPDQHCNAITQYVFMAAMTALVLANSGFVMLDTLANAKRISRHGWIWYLCRDDRHLFRSEHYAVTLNGILYIAGTAAMSFIPGVKQLFSVSIPVLGAMYDFAVLFSFLFTCVALVVLMSIILYCRKGSSKSKIHLLLTIHVARLQRQDLNSVISVQDFINFVLGEQELKHLMWSFAQREMSLENLMLYVDIQRYRALFTENETIQSHDRRCRMAVHIIDTYFAPGSAMEANLSSNVRLEVVSTTHDVYEAMEEMGENLSQGSRIPHDLFADALTELLQNLQDIVLRFAASREFRLHTEKIVLRELVLHRTHL